VEDIAVGVDDESWVVICPDSFQTSRGLHSRLTERLTLFYNEQKRRIEQRNREIREYHERNEREERESDALRLRTERVPREAAAENERARIAKEEVKQQARVGNFEEILVSRLLEEVDTIRELEEHVQKRKHMLQVCIQELPAPSRSLFDDSLSSHEGLSSHEVVRSDKAECVVCHDEAATRAVIPCGHHCLCDECAELLASRTTTSRLCPLCRGVLTSSLKIFAMK